MAPIPDSNHFPPLDKCLSGQHYLISWATIRTALLELYDLGKADALVESLLSEQTVRNLLTRPFEPFTLSVGKDIKADFETRLSAANSGSNNGYNIQEIKEDALWLSNETQIDEVSALRIVVLEYQSRPEAQLRNNFSVEEGASLQAAAGDINTESSNLLQSALKSTALAFTGNEASEQEKRRLRSVHIYFSERQNLLACSKLLYHIGFRRTEQKGKGVATTPQWIDRISEEFVRNQDESPERYVHYIIVQVQRLFASLEKGSSGWFKSIGGREDVEAEWANMRLAEITHALEILLVVLDRRRFDTRSGDNVRSWFQLAMSIGFFEGQSSPDPTFQHSIYSIQGLIAAISLSILDISNTVDHILEDSDALADVQHYYVHDIQTLGEVHKMITEMALSNSRIGSPAILAWAVMLYTMQNVVQMRLESPETPVSENAPAYKLYVDFLDSITPRDLHNKAAEPLAMYAVDEAKVFDILRDLAISFGASSGPDLHSGLDCRVRISILDLIARSGGHVMYSAEVVDAVLAALEGDSGYWDVATKGAGLADENPTAYFLQNNLLVEQVLNVAAARFPYEDLPFLKLVRALATCERYDTDGVPAVMKVLDVLPSFTAQLPDDFDSYETIDEDTALNDIRLTDDFPLFEVRPNLGLIYKRGSRTMAPGLRQIEENFTIPAYTPGRIIVESLPRVALFFHQYSCINYVGKLLETGMAPAEYFDALTQQRASREVLVEIISILASLVSTSVRINEASGGVGDSNGCAKTILEQAGRELDRNRDVVSVVSLIFEEELEHQADGSSPDNSLDLLIACLQFFHALLPVVPGRVWPVLARSGLLDKDGRPGRLRSIITSVELVSARYDFLLSCVHLFSELVEDCASHAVLRKVSLNKAANRHDDDDNLGTGVPEHVVPNALLAYTATLLDVYETACNWKYAIPSHRLLIARSISTVFEKLIYYTYGVGETPSAGSKLTSSLHESARFLIDRFLSPTAGPLRFQPLFRGLLDGFMTPELTVNTSYFLLWTSQVEAILKLTQTLVKAGTVLGKNDSHLRGQLFSVSPLIARLYAKYDSYRLSVVTLLRSLVVASASGSEEPPSLLGHLGQETSTNFLSILTRMGKPFKDDNHIIPVWQLLSAVVSNRQQWFAIYILTGSKPRDALKNAEDKSKSEISKPFLDVALEELSNINNIPIERAIAILEFISLAQNYWPWAMLDIQNKSTIITSIADFVSGLEVLSQSANDEKSIRGAKEARVAAYVAEILAMHLYHCRQTGNTSQVKDVLAKLQYYRRCAASPPLYNSSLHGNLAKNFTTRFAGTSTHDFKRSAITQKDIGPDYYYDLGLARKMLCFSPAWKGKKDDGNGQELVKANINLSVVDAQIALLHGWKMLAIELSYSIDGKSPNSEAAAEVAVQAVNDCLNANTRSTLPETIFARLDQKRADFALVLLQRLVLNNSAPKKVKEILPTVWRTISSLDTTFELSISTGDAAYYRTLLRILFLTLRAQTVGDGTESMRQSVNNFSDAAAQTIHITLDVLDKIVGRGFRDLATASHEQSQSIQPDDIALITAILQTCLLVPGIETRRSQIQAIFSNHETARTAISLFSWSEKLAIDGDPIYGELSVLFLLELSTIPEIAEQLAVDGLLGSLSSASLISYMRRRDVHPFSDSVGSQRCYSIWVRGFLPLLLNLLARLEASIAPEVALFLNQFPNLLQQAESSLDPHDQDQRMKSRGYKSKIALLQVTEVHSLALLTRVLENYRQAGHANVMEVNWDSSNVAENVESWLDMQKVIGERIVPLGQREIDLAQIKGPSGTSRLEEKVVDELMAVKEVMGSDGDAE